MPFIMRDFTMEYYRKFKPYTAQPNRMSIESAANSARSSTISTSSNISTPSSDDLHSARG